MSGSAATPVIRDAAEPDLARIFEIYDHYVLHGIATLDTEPKSPDQRRRWLAERGRAPYAVLVAERAGAVAGWAALAAWSPKRGYARTAEVSIFVDPDARRTGVGGVLMPALLDRAKDNGLGVLLSRIADRQGSSVAFHRAFGFRTLAVMRRVGEKHGRVLDVELMELHLDE